MVDVLVFAEVKRLDAGKIRQDITSETTQQANNSNNYRF